MFDWVTPILTVMCEGRMGVGVFGLSRQGVMMMGLSSWRGLPFKGPTSLSGAMISHHIMDYTMQGLKPAKPESSCARADSRPVVSVVCFCENMLYSQV